MAGPIDLTALATALTSLPTVIAAASTAVGAKLDTLNAEVATLTADLTSQATIDGFTTQVNAAIAAVQAITALATA